MVVVQGLAGHQADIRDFRMSVVEALRDAIVLIFRTTLKMVDNNATPKPTMVDLIDDAISQLCG